MNTTLIDKLTAASQAIQTMVPCAPKMGIVLGSGLGDYAEQFTDKVVIPYSEIPYFFRTTVQGHKGQLIIANIDGVQVAILQGRIHAYEGHSLQEIVFGVRTLATLGIEYLLLTNAAGGVNTHYRPGDLVLIEDHINLMGNNPLIGPNISELGPRFPDMTNAYNRELRSLIQAAAKDIDYPIKSGVYCGLLGPTYETPAEIRMLRTLGADLVGMSTVPEILAANHLGLKAAAISCVTNMAAGITGDKLSHDEVKEQAAQVAQTFSALLTATIRKVGERK